MTQRSRNESKPLDPRLLPRPSRWPWLAGVLALALLVPTVASAKTFVVNKRGDHVPGPCTKQDCTLREAVIRATNRGGDDRVRLPSRKPYRLKRDATLPGPDHVKGDLEVGDSFFVAPANGLKMVHPGKGRAKIDASASGDRAIDLLGSLRLRKVVVRGGLAYSASESGGGIRVNGTLVLLNSKVVGNHAPDVGGGIAVQKGQLYSRKSVIKNNTAHEAGGVYVETTARLDMSKSTVADNEAEGGNAGGIWAAGKVGTSWIRNSTISGNAAADDGGGVDIGEDEQRILNTTIAGNTAGGRGGGIYARAGSNGQLNGVTIARNRADSDSSGGPDTGGGIFADGGGEAITIQNSLLAKNRATGGALNECWGPSPPGIGTLGGNLITSAANGCDYFDHAQDLIAGNPRIGQLKDKGGPTKTIPLRAGSPAIGEADGPDPLETDQRGVARSNPDIGAYER